MEPRIEFWELDKLAHLPRNPKEHDLGALTQSYGAWGMLKPIVINGATGRVLSGNGRLDGLRIMKLEGQPPPANVRAENGVWFVPVVVGISIPPEQEEAAALALNRTHDLGGYDEKMLVTVLSDLAANGLLAGTGYDGDDVDRMLRLINPLDAGAEPTPLPPVDISGAGDLAIRVIVTFADAEERDRFWDRLGWEPEQAEIVTVRWLRIAEALGL